MQIHLQLTNQLVSKITLYSKILKIKIISLTATDLMNLTIYFKH